MDIIVPSIFVTKNPKEVDVFFPSEGGVVNFEALAESDSARFFRGGQGKNVIKLTHEVNFSSKEPTKLRLSVVDPERSFEQFFLSPIQNDEVTTSAIFNDNGVKVIANRFQEDDIVYIAYGFGQKKENWSSAHVLRFVDLKIYVGSEGLRTFDIGFVPSLEPIVTKAKAYYDGASLGVQ